MTAGWISSVLLAATTACLGGDDCSPTAIPVAGRPADAQLQVGTGEGYRVESIEACGADAMRIRIRGGGTRSFSMVAGGGGDGGVSETRVGFLNRIDSDLRSAGTQTGGVRSRSCGDGPVMVSGYLSLSDWRLVDRAVAALGRALADADMAETVEVIVEPETVFCPV